jgi:hypothetical protein
LGNVAGEYDQIGKIGLESRIYNIAQSLIRIDAKHPLRRIRVKMRVRQLQQPNGRRGDSHIVSSTGMELFNHARA